MILQIVAIRDQAADAYMRPIFVNHIAQAIRSFSDEVNRNAQDNDMARHPGDFELFHLGTYDDSTGELSSFDRPLQLAIGKNLKEQGNV